MPGIFHLHVLPEYVIIVVLKNIHEEQDGNVGNEWE
jgi:hypothetical protein